MMRGLAMMLAALMIAPNLLWAQTAEKPVAALGRVATLGKISEGQKRIITTRLESKLSQAYQLISQEQYQRAEEAAFAELDLDKCTAEECIRKIQEILQVERLFILQIIAEPELTQLSLNLVRTDSKQVVESICENCSLIKMYEQIDQLADQLITADIEQSARELIAEQPVGPLPPQQEEEGGGLPWWGWALIGVGAIGLAASSSSSSDSSSGGDGTVGFGY